MEPRCVARPLLVCVVLLASASTHAQASFIGAKSLSLDVLISVSTASDAHAQPKPGEIGAVEEPDEATIPTLQERPPPAAVPAQAVPCSGPPPSNQFVSWSCPGTTADGGQCAGSCLSGAVAPLGSAVASCRSGQWFISRTCMAGGVYNFDDITTDGSAPSRFLGLAWTGLRVTRSSSFTACDGNNGFRYGVLSGPNVAYSLEIGATAGAPPGTTNATRKDMTNYVRVAASNAQQKISVLGFHATAAWQDQLRIEVAAWDAANQQLGVRAFILSFFRPTLIDLRPDTRFHGIHSLTIVASGGSQVSCKTGQQVVLDNMEVYLHGD